MQYYVVTFTHKSQSQYCIRCQIRSKSDAEGYYKLLQLLMGCRIDQHCHDQPFCNVLAVHATHFSDGFYSLCLNSAAYIVKNSSIVLQN